MSKCMKYYQIAFVGALLGGCASGDGFVPMHGDASIPPTEIGYLKGVYEYRNGSTANETIRIVQVDGEKVKSQFGVAEGANMVSLAPGEHDVKVLWVHARADLDLYTYSTVRMQIHPNCLYQFYSKIATVKKEVYIDVMSSAMTKVGNQQCGEGIVQRYEQRA